MRIRGFIPLNIAPTAFLQLVQRGNRRSHGIRHTDTVMRHRYTTPYTHTQSCVSLSEFVDAAIVGQQAVELFLHVGNLRIHVSASPRDSSAAAEASTERTAARQSSIESYSP